MSAGYSSHLPIASRYRGSLVLAAACLSLAGSCAAQAPDPGPPARRILLVGNSLTHANRLPEMVAALARAAGLDWEVHSVVMMGASLADHLESGLAAGQLGQGRWDFVVLQQGPSTLTSSRDELLASVRRFAPLIRRAGAAPALYMVWPDSSWSAGRFEADFDRIRDHYREAAEAVGGRFLAAGESWREVRRRDPCLPLYGPDAFHPAPEGSYVAALAIFAGLSVRGTLGLPARLQATDGTTLVALKPDQAARVQQAVDLVTSRYLRERSVPR